MKRLFPALLLCVAGGAHAWGMAGLGPFAQYENGSAPAPVQVQQPAYNPTDNYNVGYNDGYNESHGYMGRHGYGPHYDEGYNAARKAQVSTMHLNGAF